MTTYSDDVINKALQKALISAVASVQDSLNIQFVTVSLDLDIYGDQSKVRFSTVPEHVLQNRS